MDIFFTQYDERIVGESKRDPLGLQPIWSYFGSRVIKNITTVSNDFRGFRETLLCLAIAGECVNSNGGMLKQYILLFEQLFMYTMIDAGESDGIIGNDNGRARLNKYDDPVITWKSDQAPGTILKSEISIGYYGRYKTPLMNMGIIDSKSCLKPLSIDVESLFGKDYLIVKESFKAFLKKRNHRFSDFDNKGRDALRNCVCGPFRRGEKDFWIGKINSDNLHDHKRDTLMYTCLDIFRDYLDYQDYQDWPNAESFFKELYKKSGSTDVENILKIEPFLICIEYVFYNILNSRSVDDVKLPKENYFEDCLAKAKTTCIEGSVALKERFDRLFKDCGTYSDLVQGVLRYHKFVCDKKRSSYWADITSSGNIHTFIHDGFFEDYKFWNRDYYYFAYRNIINGIEEADRWER